MNPPERWESPAARLSNISPGDLHLWRFRLDGIGSDDQTLWGELSTQEQERANRFYFDLHRQRFLRTHAFCRKILARYTHAPAAQLDLQALPNGKPYLVDSTGQDLRFNLSHSGDIMILAVTVRVDVGVDVEIHSEALDWRQIAASYFESREVAALERLADINLQRECFYRIWTMKEAYLKARGQGIAAGLRHTIVKTGAGLPLEFAALPGGENEIRRWQVFFFQPATGASGTVVIERGSIPYRLTRFDGTFIAQDLV